MTGAAGGLSGGLFAFRGAKLMPGAAYVLDLIGFDRRARAASLVITGEGRLDEQTPAGKAVAEAAARCRQAGVACKRSSVATISSRTRRSGWGWLPCTRRRPCPS